MDWQPIFLFVKWHVTFILQEIVTVILSLPRMERAPSGQCPSSWAQELIILLYECCPQSCILTELRYCKIHRNLHLIFTSGKQRLAHILMLPFITLINIHRVHRIVRYLIWIHPYSGDNNSSSIPQKRQKWQEF